MQAAFFFFNDTATTEIYTLSLHDALPISDLGPTDRTGVCRPRPRSEFRGTAAAAPARRSEEHTSELQSQSNLVCRLLLEKKKRSVRQNIHSQLTHQDESGHEPHAEPRGGT